MTTLCHLPHAGNAHADAVPNPKFRDATILSTEWAPNGQKVFIFVRRN